MAGWVYSTSSTGSERSEGSSTNPLDAIVKAAPSKIATAAKSKSTFGKKMPSSDVDIEAQDCKVGNPANVQGAKAIVVTDLSVYDGNTLNEQVGSFIQAHPVVMFSQTWCLFSIDDMEFMVKQLHVSVHSLEVDVHPKRKEIAKSIGEKTGHKTTPAIFIRGEFLGGFEQVNSLYATGSLQKDYLGGLSQADKCEEFIVKAKLRTKPFFWFPEQVNGNFIRIGGLLICGISLAAPVLPYWYNWGAYLTYGLAVDFLC